MSYLEEIKKLIITGELDKIEQAVKVALGRALLPKQILDHGLIAAMKYVGECFKKNEMFIPEVMISAKTMQAGLNIVEPLLAKTGCKPKGVVVIGTVKSDLHDIGKNIVAMMFKGAGFEVVDLGIDVAPERFADKVKETKAEIVAMSALITTSMPFMKKTILVFKAKKLQVKTMVGGAALTRQFAEEIGADGYAPDAASAVDCAAKLLEA